MNKIGQFNAIHSLASWHRHNKIDPRNFKYNQRNNGNDKCANGAKSPLAPSEP